MKDFDEANKKRAEIVNSEDLIVSADEFYNKNKSKDAGKKNKGKSIAVNIRVKKSDLEIFDFFSEVFGKKRASIISEILSKDIGVMFNSLGIAERTHLAEMVDNYITENGIDHEYKGMTWMLEVMMPDQDAYNPINHKDWNNIRMNLEK